jgi:hypothetical protein
MYIIKKRSFFCAPNAGGGWVEFIGVKSNLFIWGRIIGGGNKEAGV